MPKLTKKLSVSDVRTDGRTDGRNDPYYRKASLLKIIGVGVVFMFFCFTPEDRLGYIVCKDN